MTKPNSYVVHALRRKYAELAGELRACRAQASRIRKDMGHVSATLRMFADEDLDGVKPIAPPARCKWFKHRQCSRAILEVLRTAEAALTLREVTERVIERCRLQGVDEAGFRSIQDTVKHALSERRGTLLEADDGQPMRWRVRD